MPRDRETALRALFWTWLATSAAVAYWFAWAAISALWNVGTDPGGNLVFESASAGTTVYPFTYLAAFLALGGLTASVYVQRRQGGFRFLGAALVGYVSVVGMINVYEQVFLAGLASHTHSSTWWVADWGTVGTAAFTLLGLTWALASVPWWRRANLALAGPLLAVFVGTMGLWMLLGFPTVESGLGWVYALNAASRLTATLIPVALSTPDVWRERFLALVRARLRIVRGAPPVGGERHFSRTRGGESGLD